MRVRGGVRADMCWKAGRRRAGRKVVMRLRDVTMAGGGRRVQGGSDAGDGDRRAVSQSDECGTDTDKSDFQHVEFGSNCGFNGSVAMDGDTMEEVMIMANAGRVGRYDVGSRWHEPTMIAMMRQFGSPSLRWRFGDG